MTRSAAPVPGGLYEAGDPASPPTGAPAADETPLQHTLTARLSVLLLSLLLVTLGVFAIVVEQVHSTRLRDLLARQQFATVSYVAEDIDSRLQLRLDGLAMIARLFPQSLLGSPQRLRQYLADQRVIYHLFDGGLTLITPDGTRLLADYPALPRRGEVDWAKVLPLETLRRTRLPVIGRPHVEQATGRASLIFAAPIQSETGDLLAVLTGLVSIESSNFLDLVRRPRPGTRADFLVVAPEHGVFVTGTDTAFVLKPLPAPGRNRQHDRYMAGFEGSGVAASSVGVVELSSARRIPSANWFVVARLPVDEAFAPIRASRRMVWGGALLLSLLVAGIALVALRRALQPLGEATAAMEAMSRGESPLAPLAAPARRDETGRLIESFNRLIARIVAKEAALSEGERTWRGLLNAVGEAVCVLDERGAFVDVNAGAERLYGLRREELIGRTPEFFAAPGRNDLPTVAAMFAAALAGQSQRFEFWGRRADGCELLTEVSLYPGQYFGRPVVIAVARDITERRRIDDERRQAEERFATLFRASPLAIAVCRLSDGQVIEVNDALRQLLGDTAPCEDPACFEPGLWLDGVSRSEWRDALRRLGRVSNREVSLRRRDGVTLHLLLSSALIELGGTPCIVNFLLDVTEMRRAQEGLRLMANIFEHTHDGMIITDENAIIVDVNAAFSALTGYSREEAIGRNPSFLQSGRHDALFYQRMWQSLREQGVWSGEIWNQRRDGQMIAEILTISRVPGLEPGKYKYVGIFTDITGLKEAQAELEQMAHYDALTGLPNRVLLRDRLEQGLARARREKCLLGVCFVDLDGFKSINDRLGQDAGDHLLTEIARRLKEALRGEDTVARLGGDEFVVLVTGLHDVIELEAALARLMQVITAATAWQGEVLALSASIGVTVYPHDGADAETLLRHADQAMYLAKQAGRNRYCFFDASQERAVRELYVQQENLRQALSRGELVLHYQPKVHLRSGQPVGVECLIRWRHPDGGLRYPGQFLPWAEENDLIIDIGEWSLREALGQLRQWRFSHVHLPVAVNIAARHLKHPEFVDRIAAVLAEFPDLPPHSLELEVVETSAIDDIEAARAAVEGCAELGVDFALDDFGTGYSSLVYLRNLPVRSLKIDSSFVRDMGDDPHDLAIVEGVVGLGQAFGRRVVAEGVETEEQGLLLLQLGCQIGQGFGIARPMPGSQVLDWLDTYEPPSSWQADVSSHWRREDFSLLAAEVEHRHWVERVLAALRDGGPAMQGALDERQCRFGRWYFGEGSERYGHLPGYAAIDALHVAVHQAARRVLAERGDRHGEAERIATLMAARDQLLRGLRELRQQVIAARRKDEENER